MAFLLFVLVFSKIVIYIVTRQSRPRINEIFTSLFAAVGSSSVSPVVKLPLES